MEYTETYFKSIDEAMEDEAFVTKLAAAESKEQIKELFQQEKGITLEDEAAQAAFDKAENIRNGGELTAEDLENVAGGCWRSRSGAINYRAIIGTQIARLLIFSVHCSGLKTHHIFR